MVQSDQRPQDEPAITTHTQEIMFVVQQQQPVSEGSSKSHLVVCGRGKLLQLNGSDDIVMMTS